MFLTGAGKVDLTRSLSQKVTSVVPTVTYFLITVTQNVLTKTKFITIVVRKVIMHVVVGQKVKIFCVEIQLEVQVVVQVKVEVEVIMQSRRIS